MHDAGNSHTIAKPKALFAVARPVLGVVQIRAWLIARVIRVINYVRVVWLDDGLERRTNTRNPRWLFGRQASAQHDEGE